MIPVSILSPIITTSLLSKSSNFFNAWFIIMALGLPTKYAYQIISEFLRRKIV
jgi:hypothetical protein